MDKFVPRYYAEALLRRYVRELAIVAGISNEELRRMLEEPTEVELMAIPLDEIFKDDEEDA
jgi:hypothetical protein